MDPYFPEFPTISRLLSVLNSVIAPRSKRRRTCPAIGAEVLEIRQLLASAPTDISISTSSVPENRPNGTTVGSFTSVDPDSAQTFTYALVPGTGSTDNAKFTIVSNLLKTASHFDFESKSTYSIRVQTRDQTGLVFQKQMIINVTNVNEAPTSIRLSKVSVPENQPIGSVVGTFATADRDAAQTFTYSLVGRVGSTDHEKFTIVGNQLRTAAVFNFEWKSSYTFLVQSRDQGGLIFRSQMTISVTNVNESPTTIVLSNSSIQENTFPLPGTVVGTFFTGDPDTAQTFTYSLVAGPGSNDNVRFKIAGNQLKPNSFFNFEERSLYSIRVQTTDQGGLTFQKQMFITVTDVNERPFSISLSGNHKVNHNRPIGTVVGTFTTLDPDFFVAQSFTYSFDDSISTGTDGLPIANAKFTIVGNQLRTAIVFTPNMAQTREIYVRTTDQDGLSYSQLFEIRFTSL